jgi:hypothetical protein
MCAAVLLRPVLSWDWVALQVEASSHGNIASTSSSTTAVHLAKTRWCMVASQGTCQMLVTNRSGVQ